MREKGVLQPASTQNIQMMRTEPCEGGGLGKDGVDVGEEGDGVDGGGNCGMRYFIN